MSDDNDSSGTVSAAGGAGSAGLLWGPRPRPTRGPKPLLTIDGITRAAIKLADADGIAAVSMQRVARDFGLTKMALYRYIPGKAELVALMIDAASGPPPDLADGAPDDWRGGLETWARALLAVFWRHPWLLDVTVGPRTMGPNELGWTEAALAALAGTGLDGGEMLDAVATIAGHIRTIAQQARPASGPGTAEATMGTELAKLMRTHGERFPALTTALASAVAHGTQDKALDFGLRCILDGLAVRMARGIQLKP